MITVLERRELVTLLSFGLWFVFVFLVFLTPGRHSDLASFHYSVRDFVCSFTYKAENRNAGRMRIYPNISLHSENTPI